MISIDFWFYSQMEIIFWCSNINPKRCLLKYTFVKQEVINVVFSNILIAVHISSMVSTKILCHEVKREVFSSLICVHCCWCTFQQWAEYPVSTANTSDFMSIPVLLKDNLYYVFPFQIHQADTSPFVVK